MNRSSLPETSVIERIGRPRLFFPKLTLHVFRFRGIYPSNCDANRMRWFDFPT